MLYAKYDWTIANGPPLQVLGPGPTVSQWHRFPLILSSFQAPDQGLATSLNCRVGGYSRSSDGTPLLPCPTVMLSLVLTNWTKWCPLGSCLNFFLACSTPSANWDRVLSWRHRNFPSAKLDWNAGGHVQGWLAFHIVCSWGSLSSPKYGGLME